MYLRFVSQRIDEDSHKPRGVFTEAYALLDSGELKEGEWKQLRADLDWFNVNLTQPPKKFQASRAIFWFRKDALECIDKIWDIVHLLRTHDCPIAMLSCRHLQNRIYSDEFQVAAYPHPLDDRIIEH